MADSHRTLTGKRNREIDSFSVSEEHEIKVVAECRIDEDIHQKKKKTKNDDMEEDLEKNVDENGCAVENEVVLVE